MTETPIKKRRLRRRANAANGWGGARPGAGRPRTAEAPIKLAERLTRIEERLSDLAGIQARATTVQMGQFESLPAILRRLTEIERKMGMREKVQTPRFDRKGLERPRLSKAVENAEEIFRR